MALWDGSGSGNASGAFSPLKDVVFNLHIDSIRTVTIQTKYKDKEKVRNALKNYDRVMENSKPKNVFSLTSEEYEIFKKEFAVILLKS